MDCSLETSAFAVSYSEGRENPNAVRRNRPSFVRYHRKVLPQNVRQVLNSIIIKRNGFVLNTRLLLGALATAAVLASPAHAKLDGKVPEPGMVTFVTFSADGCQPCRLMEPALRKLDQEYEGRAAIREIVGPVDLMLRPPYGFVDDTLRQWAKAPIICWSLDTEDWKDPTPSRITADILRQVKDGDIILMHDIFDTSVTAALAAVDQLLAQGYRLVTVEELFAQRGQDPQPGAVYCSLPPAQKEEVEP